MSSEKLQRLFVAALRELGSTRGSLGVKVNALFSPRDQATLLLVHLVELKCYSEMFNAYLTYLMYFISCFLTVTKLTEYFVL